MNSESLKTWVEKCLKADSDVTQDSSLSADEISSITEDVLLDLKSYFEHFLKAFNELKASYANSPNTLPALPKNSLDPIYIYDLTDAQKGFMLFRKGCRLIFSQEKPGYIRIQMRLKKDNFITAKQIDTFVKASVQNAVSMKWTHQEHQGFVDFPILARYYMKLFLQLNKTIS